ncbi:MAG: hypothetical protein ACEY3D_05095 [Rickettsia sp.]
MDTVVKPWYDTWEYKNC